MRVSRARVRINVDQRARRPKVARFASGMKASETFRSGDVSGSDLESMKQF